MAKAPRTDDGLYAPGFACEWARGPENGAKGA
jgi:hypothetical protein